MGSATARSTWTWARCAKVLERYGHWRRLQDHVTMLSEAEGVPIGRAVTNEEHKRLLETAASNPEWEHVYCAAVLAWFAVPVLHVSSVVVNAC